tara:strand:- start:383 stop:3154 length:2772 start_codon:yes stop_codon:yes gene_type:complete
MSLFKAERKIWILCGIYFLLALCSLMARATADSLFLKNFDKSSIPLMIMAAAAMSSVVALFTTYLCARIQVYGALKLALTALAVALIGVVAAIGLAGGKVVAVLTYMVCDVVVVTPMVLFWGLAVGVLNPKESKQWFGLIGAAGTVGCIVAGYVVSLASRSGQVDVLSLGLVTGLMVVVLVGLARTTLFDQGEPAKQPAQAAKAASTFRALGGMLGNRQALLMLSLVVLSTMVICLIDIHFKFQVAKDHEENLNQFFGQFYTYSSLAQLVLQLFIVRTLLTKGGVITAITVLPVLLVICSVSALLFAGEKGVYAGKFICQVIFFTIEYAGLQMLFLAVKKQSRGQMKSVIDGLARPATIAASSLLITATLAFWQQDSLVRLNTVVIVAGVVWLIVAWLNYRQYLVSLVGMLDSRVIDFDDESDVLMDSRFDSQLRVSLAKASDFEAGFLADLIIGMHRPDWCPEFRAMLDKPDETLQRAGVRYLAEFGNAADREHMVAVGLANSPAFRKEVVFSLGAHCTGRDFRVLEPFLDDHEPEVRCACAAALLNSGELSLNVRAGNVFYEFLHSENVEDRRHAVRCLSMIRHLDTGQIVRQLLDDPDNEIRREAIHAIDETKLESTFGRLAELIQKETLQPAVSACLQAIGPVAAERIGDHLGAMQYETAPDTFRFLTQILIEAGEGERSPRIEGFIEQVRGEADRARLMTDYLRSLSSDRGNRQRLVFAREQLAEYIQKADIYRQRLAKLPSGPDAEALHLACEHQFQLRLRVLYEVFRLFDPTIDYKKLFRAAMDGGENERAEAGEVLEGVLGQADAEQVMRLAKPTADEGEFEGVNFFVQSFRDHDSKWIRAGLLLLAGGEYDDHREWVGEHLRHAEPLVRETALDVFLSNESSREAVMEQCNRSIADSCAAVVRLARRKLSTLEA